MQALVLRGPYDLELGEVEEPRIGPGEVLVAVDACGICGSDVHGYQGLSPRRSAHLPLIMGHELSGQVVEVGAEVADPPPIGARVVVHPQISCGRCRACRAGYANICPSMVIIGIERAGGFAPLLAVPAHRVFSAPDDLSPEAGAMVETLAVEVHCFRAMVPSMPRTIVVMGAGAQGLLAVQLARLSGAQQVLVCDPVVERLALAERLGADVAANPAEIDVAAWVRNRTGGWGADAVVETSGVPQARQQALAALAPGGSLLLVGLGHGETEFDCLPIVGRELVVRGSYCYHDDDFVRALELLRDGSVQVDGLVTVAALADGVAEFRRLVERPRTAPKVVLRP